MTMNMCDRCGNELDNNGDINAIKRYYRTYEGREPQDSLSNEIELCTSCWNILRDSENELVKMLMR